MAKVGLLLIGNELLSGKIRDENGHHLAQTVYECGSELSFVLWVPDELERIADAVNAYRHQVDLLVTSGGVGPTHDDITYAAIAHAFNVPLARHHTLVERIQAHFGDQTTAAHLKMAHLPQGAELIFPRNARWPTISVENVYIFPGVPQIFRAKLSTIQHLLIGPKPTLRILEVEGDEGTIASTLEEAERVYGVTIGSYPILSADKTMIRITIEAKEAVRVDAASNALVEQLRSSVDTITSKNS